MTRKEAIAFFKDMNECTYGNLEEVEMAIKALEFDIHKWADEHFIELVEKDVWADAKKALQAQADGDLISRQAVIDAIDKWVKNMGVLIALPVSEVTPLFDSIHKLPSIKPQEPKTGHWIIYKDCEGKTRECTCDQCGYKTGKYTWQNPNFCAGCGADMRGKQHG